MNLIINKNNWKKVRLVDVCEWYQKNILNEEQVDFGIKYYVTANDIDSDSLKFDRFNDLSDGQKGPTITKHFEKGDLLLSTRSVALRKAALAPISGVTGEKLLVLRSKENSELLKELMPFVFQSMDFWEYAQNSASGSVNKFTSWTKIREYEFLLPPKDQQSKIAELLWAMDDVVEKNLQIYEKLQISLDSTIEKEIHGCELYDKTINEVIKEIDKKIGMISINEIGHILKGKGIPKKDLSEKGKPCIRYGELYTKHHRTINKYYSFIDKSKINTTVLLRKDDVLFAGSGETIEEIGKSASFISNDEVYAGGDILILRTENMNGFYLGFLMNSLVVRKQLNKYGTGATVIHIYPDDIKKIMIPNLDKQKQDKIAIKFKNYANNISLIINKIKQSKQLQKSLINEIFSS